MPAWTRISELVTVVGPALNRLGQREEVDAALRAGGKARHARETHSRPRSRAATVRVDR